MSKLVLKGIDFGAENLDTYAPQIPHNFCVWLTLSIGPKDVEGSHLFQVGICTVAWLAHQLSIKGACVLRHMILVEKFDINLIKKQYRWLSKTLNDRVGMSLCNFCVNTLHGNLRLIKHKAEFVLVVLDLFCGEFMPKEQHSSTSSIRF